MIPTNATYLIIGSNSFAGAVMVNGLVSGGNRVIGVSRSIPSPPTSLLLPSVEDSAKFHFYQIDINFQQNKLDEILELWKPEYILDFAGQGMVAQSWESPQQWIQTNLVAKTQLLELLRTKIWLKKYIRASTPEVYGSHINQISEEENYSPSTPYAITHASIDMMLKAYHDRYSFPSVVGRFSNFYGPGQQLFRIIPKGILSARIGIQLPLEGGGNSERSFLHSRDIFSAFSKLVECGRLGEVYNFSSSEIFSIREVIEMIAEKMGTDPLQLIKVVQDRPSRDMRYLMDYGKASRELSWKSEVSFSAGLDDCINWYQNNLGILARLPLSYNHKP